MFLTLWPKSGGYDTELNDEQYSRISLIPFAEWFGRQGGPGINTGVEFFSNIAMFAAGAFLVRLLLNKSLAYTVAFTTAAGVITELGQLILTSNRSVSIDDVIAAVVGGLIGFAVGALLRRLLVTQPSVPGKTSTPA
ncbi:VanZ family protein [Glutamicibacter endophyticus]|uniref:VanZ family protein n=1 Tax=Glutamicibacter endophyticus TaxID=1522174 RepID=UPI003AEF72AD